ncbi:hypothetical protein [Streptomyces sp. NPDC001315]|uniref:hypothetical protein n=1 Tax=Streptomyces sp. NPDC001315 TaxID=3364562 RepID=UPI0036773768
MQLLLLGAFKVPVGAALSLTDRPGFAQACRYAAQGSPHGITAAARPVITTDDDTPAHVLDRLHSRGLFLAFPPTLTPTTEQKGA